MKTALMAAALSFALIWPSLGHACVDGTSWIALIGLDDISGDACAYPDPPEVQAGLTRDSQGIIDGGDRIVIFSAHIYTEPGPTAPPQLPELPEDLLPVPGGLLFYDDGINNIRQIWGDQILTPVCSGEQGPGGSYFCPGMDPMGIDFHS